MVAFSRMENRPSVAQLVNPLSISQGATRPRKDKRGAALGEKRPLQHEAAQVK
jgi:hypothetical protein